MENNGGFDQFSCLQLWNNPSKKPEKKKKKFWDCPACQAQPLKHCCLTYGFHSTNLFTNHLKGTKLSSRQHGTGKPDSNDTRLPPDVWPTFLSVILRPASLMSGKWGKNGEALWLENGHSHRVILYVKRMLSFISHLCGFTSCFCVTYQQQKRCHWFKI